jgi:hypothetical protein
MKRETVVPYAPQAIILSRWVGIAFLLLLLAGVGYMYYLIKCIDGCGPYHNSTSVADLDDDGDLDVVLSNLRHDGENGFWAGPTLWINQGGGKFTPRRVDFGGSSTAIGDVDGDGDPDIVQLEYTNAVLYLNHGGEQGGNPGEFGRSRTISPRSHNGSTRGTIVLGDLNNDGRLDALAGYCCTIVIERQTGGDGFLPFFPWVWMNTPDEKGNLMGHSVNLISLGDLPLRPTLGDLDGDGDLDMFAAILPPKSADYDSVDRVLLNDGNGSFVDSGQRLDSASLAGAAGSAAVALGDLDGDGDLDALVGKAAGAVIWTNQGGAQSGQAGVFADSSQRLGRGSIEAAFLDDLDADGDLDAVVAGKAEASIWWNDGRADFQDSGQRLRYTERHGLAIADFNRDGYLDVFSAAYDIEFHLWLNQGDGRLQEED